MVRFEVEVLKKVLSTLAHKHIQPQYPGRGRLDRRWGDAGRECGLDCRRWEARAPKVLRTIFYARELYSLILYANIHSRTYTHTDTHKHAHFT